MTSAHADAPVSAIPTGQHPVQERHLHLALELRPVGIRAARGLLDSTLPAWGVEHLRDEVGIAVGELLANAVVHASGFVHLHMRLRAGLLLVSVSDSASLPDGLTAAAARGANATAPEEESRRGLALLDAVTLRWGVRPMSEGKAVWAEFAA